MRKVEDESWIGVDFDGTLARQDPGPLIPVPPAVPAMVERVRRWLAQGRKVKIVTARVAPNPRDPKDKERIAFHRARVKQFCVKYIGQELPVVCFKDLNMIELWDDRAVQVYHNTGNPVDPSRRDS
jgi:hypothetical protein